MRTLPLALVLLAACSTSPDGAAPEVALPVGQAATACIDGDFDTVTTCGGDCADNDPNVFPGATERVGDGIDQDCDGGDLCFRNTDGDLYGDSGATVASPDLSCTDPGEARFAGDCDDGDPAIFPGATEIVANEVDDDCDGEELCHPDVDVDGYGAPTGTRRSFDLDCRDAGEAYGTDDCDDTRNNVNPGRDEAPATSRDEDCDGEELCYADGDGDAYGSTDTVASPDLDCTSPGESTVSTDCDDTLSAVRPGATEVCDSANVDEDCDGDADNDDPDAVGKSSFFTDADGDAYGTGAAAIACDAPFAGMATTAGDCDDTRAGVNPGATEVCDFANRDEDCDGGVDDADASVTGKTNWYEDSDADGYGVGTPIVRCDAPVGFEAPVPGDCDDTTASINPGAEEVCDENRTDEDCDGNADDDDDDVATKPSWYADGDDDGFGAGAPEVACHPSDPDASASDEDCDDANDAVNPDADEVCDADDVDEDCDGDADDADLDATGKTPWYADVDDDGYGAGTSFAACDALPSFPVDNRDDCDDRRGGVNPGAREVCDGANRDEDCDGAADDADPSATGQGTWSADGDGDGIGVGDAFASCDATTGHPAATDGDCDDADEDRAPGFTDVPCDEIDQDCDGEDAVDARNCVPEETDVPDTDETDVADTDETDVPDTDETDVADTEIEDSDTNDTTDSDTDTDTGKDDGKCNCANGAASPGYALLLVVAAFARRRRR